MAQQLCAESTCLSVVSSQGAQSSGHSALHTKQEQDRCPVKVLHWCIWIAACLYVMTSFATCEVNRSLPKRLNHVLTRSSYWGVTRKWDLSDREWREGRQFILMAWPWLLLHSVIGRALAHVMPSLVPHYHAAYSLLFVTFKLGWLSAAIFFAEHAAFFGLACLGVPALCYGAALLALTHYKVFDYDIFDGVYQWYGRNTYYLTAVTFYWTALRCLSFCMDFLWRSEETDSEKRQQQRRLPDYWKTLAYALYLPPLLTGPLQNYDDFDASVTKPKHPVSLDEVKACVGGLLRSAAHFLLMDFMCHYFYSSALLKAPYLVSRLNLTCLLGFGATLNVMFFIKYLVQYGVPNAFARIECLHLPPPPKCVARSHLCSHFWRYFDHGLHLWIKKYLYLPMVGPENEVLWRLLGTALAFSFMWLWHDMTVAVTFWASLSFVGIALEVGMSQIRKLGFTKKLEVKCQRRGWMRSVKAVLGSPHYLLTIFSCLFFLTNVEITTIFFKRVILGFPVPLLPVLACLYFGCQASLDVMEWEHSSKVKGKTS
ncbi:protein-cysteine N-palmitoyltransferase HHAT isoform X3 [Dermacentor silvarum]|uniref:protein-cysteine N-palmitoyltransferase HHAT isoform X3 n=1 Tax=Dermacentor silvarum TaxID=543639 RepID=UPI00210141F7|nr:protein-cysteine N-palmitoyltransferase HHAT isoform X3 [Dermacentor silvarum]